MFGQQAGDGVDRFAVGIIWIAQEFTGALHFVGADGEPRLARRFAFLRGLRRPQGRFGFRI